jgi:hypothetical protein
MPPESGGICWRLTSDLPLGCFQGGVGVFAPHAQPLCGGRGSNPPPCACPVSLLLSTCSGSHPTPPQCPPSKRSCAGCVTKFAPRTSRWSSDSHSLPSRALSCGTHSPPLAVPLSLSFSRTLTSIKSIASGKLTVDGRVVLYCVVRELRNSQPS